jgi:hypothetical protein
VLCCAVLCCAVLCCAVLCCAVLCCAVLCCAVVVLLCSALVHWCGGLVSCVLWDERGFSSLLAVLVFTVDVRAIRAGRRLLCVSLARIAALRLVCLMMLATVRG